MKIKTEILQSMVAKAIQGTSNNKMIPLTSLIGIEVKGKELTLITTDGSNGLRVKHDIEYEPVNGPQEFYTIVNAELFGKLVGKTTKEFIELENKENYLEITGNGTYKLEIAINEEGEMVRFTDIGILPTTTYKINLNNLQEAIRVGKASTAKTMELPCITGYYIGDNTITTNREMICIIQDKIIEEPILVSSEMAELLLLVEGDKEIDFAMQDGYMIFYNNNYIITGKELEGKESYPVKEITGLLSTQYNSEIKVNKQELLNVLDRMNLFVTDYDKNGVYLQFNNEGLEIKSQKSNAIETIAVPEERVLFDCLIDIEMLKAQIETIASDTVEISYGLDTSIKVTDGNIIHIISLAEKE